MDAVTVITSVLTLFAGVGIFLVACSTMSSNLQSVGAGKLKSLFKKTAGSKLFGVGAGALVTVAVQSSSAATVMIISFVDAGIMTLTQATAAIFGANIGTTVTGQLVALGMFGRGVPVSVIFSAFAGVGAFISLLAKKELTKTVGAIITGFGMLFVGLSLMSGALELVSKSSAVINFLAVFKNPVLLVVLGILLTAVIQSSAAMTSMAITMVIAGLITPEQGIYLTMGADVGTCVTALIACTTGGINARRAAAIHLVFNILGTAVFLCAGLIMGAFGTGYGYIFGTAFPNAPHVQIAMFHTVFNVLTVLLFLPFTDLLVKIVTKLIN